MSLKQFKAMVQDVCDKLGHNDTTTSMELMKVGKELIPSFKGIYARDKLPKLKDGESMIINLDTSYQPGSHWIAIYCSGNSYIIYDSFGRSIDSILPKITFSGSGKKIITSSDYDAEQQKKDTSCGQHSLAWLLFLHKYGIDKALKI